VKRQKSTDVDANTVEASEIILISSSPLPGRGRPVSKPSNGESAHIVESKGWLYGSPTPDAQLQTRKSSWEPPAPEDNDSSGDYAEVVSESIAGIEEFARDETEQRRAVGRGETLVPILTRARCRSTLVKPTLSTASWKLS
jgi:hypothetical protein